MKVLECYARIENARVIAIVRRETASEVVGICRALSEEGQEVMELPFTMERPHRLLEQVADALPNALLGAGTILDAESARIAILSGAKFLVTPTIDPGAVEMGHRYGVPVFPGVHSPTEALKALSLGCFAVKLFPAEEFSPKAIGAWRTPLPNLEIIPTGGVGLHNAEEWLQAGAFALGIGGALSGGSEREVHEKARRLREIVAGAESHV